MMITILLFIGLGTYVWAKGGSYHGLFENGKRHGKGKLISADGTIYEGMMSNRYHHHCKHQYAHH